MHLGRIPLFLLTGRQNETDSPFGLKYFLLLPCLPHKDPCTPSQGFMTFKVQVQVLDYYSRVIGGIGLEAELLPL